MAEADIVSQRELASRMGMDEGQLSRTLNDGIRSVAVLDKFCAALRCQPGDIIEHR